MEFDQIPPNDGYKFATGYFSIKNHLNYWKKQKLAYPETMQQHGR